MVMQESDYRLLNELEPVAEEYLERHLDQTDVWSPHEFVPYGRGKDFEPGKLWTPDDSAIEPLSEAVKSALIVNLLTEDNLPYYFRTIERTFGPDQAWGDWVRRWTAEEGRHSMAIYGYLMTSRLIDPVQLERDRMAQVSLGQIPEPESAADGFVYVALQELATRVAHRNTGKHLNDPVGEKLMKRVAEDENYHYMFYRDLVKAALEIDPNMMMEAIARQVKGFEMPGTGIRDFSIHEQRIALQGIFGITETVNNVFIPVVEKQWNIGNVANLSEAGEKARDKAMRRVAAMGRLAAKEQELREEYLASAA